MKVFLFENSGSETKFLPLVFTRAVADLRLGIFDFHERWHWFTNTTSVSLVKNSIVGSDDLLVSSHVVVTAEFVELATNLIEGSSLWLGDVLLARKGSLDLSPVENKVQIKVTYLESLWDLTEKAEEVLISDIALLKKRKFGLDIKDKHTVVYKATKVFIEEGVITRSAILNAEQGPIFLAKNAQVLEGAVIYGPAYIGENSIVGAGSKLLGGTYIGKNCVVGGEIKRSYIHANSNKAHEGYLGDSILGEWCNLGAGTNVSNLKNNFGEIGMWSYKDSKVQKSGRWKAGVLMGDYCKTSIGTRINSGTTMGVGSVILSSELTNKFYRNFSWGTDSYDFKKFLTTAQKMWELNNFVPNEEFINILRKLNK